MKRETDSNLQRIFKILTWLNLPVTEFESEIGLKYNDDLYGIIEGKIGITKELAQIIEARYSAISIYWLLTGNGDMFNN